MIWKSFAWCLGVEHRQCKSTQIYTTWYNMIQHVVCRSFGLQTRNERSQFWQFWQSSSLTTPRQPDLVTCSTLGTREPWRLAADAVAGPWTSSLAVEASCFQGKAERPVGMNLINCMSWRCKTVTTRWHIKGCSLDVFKVWICCTSITSH